MGLNAPAHAAGYGTPTLSLSASYLSGAVGATGDPVVTVTVGQSGADASALTVAASASTKSSVAGTGDVTVTGTGATRQVAVVAHGRGYTDLTLKLTGLMRQERHQDAALRRLGRRAVRLGHPVLHWVE